MNKQIWIVDFGSQYTQLITRKTRELNYSCEIITTKEAKGRLKEKELPSAIVLSGGPQSIFNDNEDHSIFFSLNIPILGICYGMQLIAKFFGGEVLKSDIHEYGHSKVYLKSFNIKNCPSVFSVWMSHADHVSQIPTGFNCIIKSDNNLVASIKHNEKPIVGLQFHPEVEHTEHGNEILNWFYRDIAGLKKDWQAECILEQAEAVFYDVKDQYVLCAFSGGVDSLVAATLAQRHLKEKLYCFFVDNGLLRFQDYQHIDILKKESSLNIEIIDASEDFLSKLNYAVEPEKKRTIIGNTFIEVFDNKVHEFEKNHNIKFNYLLQGTLYPDVIESVSPHKEDGKSSKIKSHHNVGGLPEKMNLKLIEPLRYLFKDEVRLLGKQLNLPDRWCNRHPFPGPGLAVRILGNINKDSISKVQESDQILFETLNKYDLYDKTWQAFTVLLPISTVGVKGDDRSFEQTICVRLVNSTDGMTAKWSYMPKEFLEEISNRITNEIAGINRVVYDITSKPPATIEWE